MDSRKLRMEILRSLNVLPNHGYALYNQLKDECKINHQSGLYKLLRKMKEEGIIEKIDVNGEKAETFKLTNKGKEEYYTILMESTENFIDFFTEVIFYHLKKNYLKKILQQKRKQGKKEIPSLFNKDNNLLVYIPPNFQRNRILNVINYLSRDFTKKQTFFIKTQDQDFTKIKPHQIINPLVKIIPIENELLTLKPKSIDILIYFGADFKNTWINDKWIELLNPQTATIFYQNYWARHGILKFLMTIFTEFLSENAPKTLGEFAEKTKNRSKFLFDLKSNPEEERGQTLKLLEKHFQHVEVISINRDFIGPIPFLGLYYATNLKQAEDEL